LFNAALIVPKPDPLSATKLGGSRPVSDHRLSFRNRGGSRSLQHV